MRFALPHIIPDVLAAWKWGHSHVQIPVCLHTHTHVQHTSMHTQVDVHAWTHMYTHTHTHLFILKTLLCCLMPSSFSALWSGSCYLSYCSLCHTGSHGLVFLSVPSVCEIFNCTVYFWLLYFSSNVDRNLEGIHPTVAYAESIARLCELQSMPPVV